MGTFQCRGNVKAILSASKGPLSILIRAKTQFDCKENKINNNTNKYNILMKVKVITNPKTFPYEADGDVSKALPEDMAIDCPRNLLNLLQIAYESEASFVIEDSTNSLVCIQVGRGND